MAHRLALTARAPDRAHAVALGVDPPPAEVRVEPLGRNGLPPLPRETLDLRVSRPGIQLALEPLGSLRLRLLYRLAHAPLPVPGRKDESREWPPLRPSSRLLSSASTYALGGVLARVCERHRHPRFTATTFRRDATGRAVDPQNGVLDHDLVSVLDHDLAPAHLAAFLSDVAKWAIHLSPRRHDDHSPYLNRFCQELFAGITASSI